MKIALAMYTVYEEMKRDLGRTLATIAAMGYQGVEFYGEALWPAGEVRGLLQQHGLVLCGWHVEWRLLQQETLEETLAYHKELGNPNIIIPCLGGPWNVGHTAEENHTATWLKHASRMNEIAAIVEDHGMRLGYHTHAHEFEDHLDGVTPWDILLEHTSPSIFLELDTGNCIEGGGDPVQALKQAAGRLEVVHCKPFSQETGIESAIADTGDLSDWAAIVEHSAAGGCRWLAAENEAVTRGDKFSVARHDLQRLATYLPVTP